jgi:hypothetical protein
MRNLFFIDKGDTFQLGIGYLDKKVYGEGGLFIVLGYYYINFWKRDEY